MTKVWRVQDDKLVELNSDSLKLEKNIGDWIENEPSMLDPDLLIIGREVVTSSNRRIDLLGIDSDGDIVVIELKKGQGSRQVVSQVLEYASWISSVNTSEIVSIAETYFKKTGRSENFISAFKQKFDVPPPEELNSKHRLLIVASSLDKTSKQIVEYLSEQHEVPINTAFFNVFSDGQIQYLSADWLMDQEDVNERAERKTKLPWSGVWYVNIKESAGGRNWQDMSDLHFVSAGGGRNWSDPLEKLEEGSELYVHVTGAGYVGHGVVTGQRMMARDYMLDGRPIFDLPTKGTYNHNVDNPDKAEYVVPVKWIKTFPVTDPKKFPGYFASTHVVCKLRKQDTLDFLKLLF